MRPGQFGYDETIPPDRRLIFADLCQDLASLYAKWATYTGLFSEADAIQVVNATAPVAFAVIEESLRSDMTMALCRIGDPAEQGKNSNLSLLTLIKGLPADHPAHAPVKAFGETIVPL